MAKPNGIDVTATIASPVAVSSTTGSNCTLMVGRYRAATLIYAHIENYVRQHNGATATNGGKLVCLRRWRC